MSEIDWSAKFNEQPDGIRLLFVAKEVILRIQHLQFEKDRLQRRHAQSLREINNHIRNCEKGLRDLAKELEKDGEKQ